jgi:hypothetical protein
VLVYFVGFNSLSLRLLQTSGPSLDAEHGDNVMYNMAASNRAPPHQPRMMFRQPFAMLQVNILVLLEGILY